MSFLSGLFGGSNPTLNSQISSLGSIASNATNLGTADTNAASNFFNSILSGNQQKIGQALAPQIAGIQGREQQSKQTASQFGNRSGGINASMQMAGDTANANLTNLVGSLTGGAASGLAGIGAQQQGLGLQAYQQQEGVSQEQLSNWQNSIFGGVADAGVNKLLSLAHI